MFRTLLLSAALIAAPITAHAELDGVWNGRLKCGGDEFGTVMILTDDTQRRGFVEVQSRDDSMPDFLTVNHGTNGGAGWIAGRASLLGRSGPNFVITGSPNTTDRMTVAVSGLRNCTTGWFEYASTDAQKTAYRELLNGGHPSSWYRDHSFYLYRKQLAVNREAHRYPPPPADAWKQLLVAGIFTCQLAGCFNGMSSGVYPDKKPGGGDGFDPTKFDHY